MTDVELAERLHRDLSALATDAGWSVTPTTGQELGHYTDPIADAKADVGVEDLSDATAAQLKRVRQEALKACLERLELYYTTVTDIKVGQRDEKLSQVATAIGRLRASAPSAGGSSAVGFTLRRGPARDYTTGDGDA